MRLFLHDSGPSLVGSRETERARRAVEIGRDLAAARAVAAKARAYAHERMAAMISEVGS